MEEGEGFRARLRAFIKGDSALGSAGGGVAVVNPRELHHHALSLTSSGLANGGLPFAVGTDEPGAVLGYLFARLGVGKHLEPTAYSI